jgi:hypothetical protein
LFAISSIGQLFVGFGEIKLNLIMGIYYVSTKMPSVKLP